MSLKRLNDKQVEIITDRYEVYVERNKRGFDVDYFKSSVTEHNAAHQESESFEDYETLEVELKRLGVDPADVAELKKMWKIN